MELLGTSPVRDLLAGQNYNSQAPANSPPHACRGGRQTGKASHLARNLGATRGFPGAVDFRWDGSSAQLHLDWQNYNQGVTACYWAVPPASPTARPRRPPSSRTSMLVIGQPGATVPVLDFTHFPNNVQLQQTTNFNGALCRPNDLAAAFPGGKRASTCHRPMSLCKTTMFKTTICLHVKCFQEFS